MEAKNLASMLSILFLPEYKIMFHRQNTFTSASNSTNNHLVSNSKENAASYSEERLCQWNDFLPFDIHALLQQMYINVYLVINKTYMYELH